MDKDTQELIEKLELLKIAAAKNPCRADKTLFNLIAGLVGRLVHSNTPMTMTDLESYFGTTSRNIRRWQQTRNFPKGHHSGRRELTYYADEIIKWELEQRNKNKHAPHTLQ